MQLSIGKLKKNLEKMHIGFIINAKKEIRKVINGSEIENASYGRWFDLCCEFRRKVTRKYQEWNEYCTAISEKEKKFLFQRKRVTQRCRDIIHLVITIKLL